MSRRFKTKTEKSKIVNTTFLRTYSIKHRYDFSDLLTKSRNVADYAVENKQNKKLLTSKYVKHIGLPSTIANQILLKYGNGTIKKASRVNLIVPNMETIRTKNRKNLETGEDYIETKTYKQIEYENGYVYIKPLKLKIRWSPGKSFHKINQIEINDKRFMISVSFLYKDTYKTSEFNNVLGIDNNCGVGRHILNCANLATGEIISLGKSGPNLRKFYFKKRQQFQKKEKKIMKGGREKRRMRDLDHKISRKVVEYALEHKLKIVVEKLTGIRRRHTKGNGSKNVNRLVNSWSFYRLQTFIEYKAKELGIPFEKINPQYTSQECSYCLVIGERDEEVFECTNKNCSKYRVKRHADNNAAFNIGIRSLQSGGRAL